jgi:hypothetical protein
MELFLTNTNPYKKTYIPMIIAAACYTLVCLYYVIGLYNDRHRGFACRRRCNFGLGFTVGIGMGYLAGMAWGEAAGGG